jgi:hypothetical protein
MIGGALMHLLVLAASPKRFRWLSGWALMIAAEWLSRFGAYGRADATTTIIGKSSNKGRLSNVAAFLLLSLRQRDQRL